MSSFKSSFYEVFCIPAQAGGVLSLTRETINLLKDKHPPPSDLVGLRLQGCHQMSNSVIYEMITGDGLEKSSPNKRQQGSFKLGCKRVAPSAEQQSI